MGSEPPSRPGAGGLRRGAVVYSLPPGIAAREPPLSTQIANELEQRVAGLINAERSAAGLPELKLEAHLNASAQAHSDWMADTGTFTHAGAGGSSATERIEETGFPLEGSWATAENLSYITLAGALDEGETDAMHRGLMDSPGHRANILDPELAYVGIGLSVGRMNINGESREVAFLTQNFADTDGEVLVQETDGGETVLQPYRDGEPEGEPEEAPVEERDPDDDREDRAASAGACFVATAAYGGAAHADVAALRRFRDRVLARHPAGRACIRAYWIAGPRLARLVDHRGTSGRLARGVIAPLARLAERWTPIPPGAGR